VWTQPISGSSIQYDLEKGTASFTVSDVPMPDFVHSANAFIPGAPSLPGRVSFRVEWATVVKRQTIDNRSQGYREDRVETSATIEWYGSTPALDFTFTSAESSPAAYAAISAEQNGVFYPGRSRRSS
jgi:hypothetical protein